MDTRRRPITRNQISSGKRLVKYTGEQQETEGPSVTQGADMNLGSDSSDNDEKLREEVANQTALDIPCMIPPNVALLPNILLVNAIGDSGLMLLRFRYKGLSFGVREWEEAKMN
ncbi:hypothetical protein PIB30_040101 [Stylosanthes scabra]|uniref:Uncharacterized protein n=1 Tax=Stylosanthes scabra TaxID=79078 RepID=A0ABU6QF12_9FABA|nr:hypothetical protein [Stylosanthes scabra]